MYEEISAYIESLKTEADAIKAKMNEKKILIDAFRKLVAEEKKASPEAKAEEKKKEIGKMVEAANAIPFRLETVLPKDVINFAFKESRISTVTFAEYIGVTPSTLAKWRNGECTPQGSTLDPAIKALEVVIEKPWVGLVMKTAVENYQKQMGARI